MTQLPSMSLYDHLVELRRRFIAGLVLLAVLFALFFMLAENIFSLISLPFIQALGAEASTHRFIYTHLPEAFLTHVQLALLGAAVVGLPFFIHQVWLFIAPGLYLTERRALRPFLILSPLLFYGGVAFAYFLILPMAWTFFLGFETPRSDYLPVVLEAKVQDYVHLVVAFCLSFGVCFQLPIALLLMGRVGLITSHTLKSGRRYAIIAIFILAAFLTPPDVVSQIALALPMILLYEFSLLAMVYQEKRRYLQFNPKEHL